MKTARQERVGGESGRGKGSKRVWRESGRGEREVGEREREGREWEGRYGGER